MQVFLQIFGTKYVKNVIIFRPESPKAREFFLGPDRAWENDFGPSGFRAWALPEHVLRWCILLVY